MSHTALIRLDVDVDAAVCRPATPEEIDAFLRGQDSSVVLDVSAATARKSNTAEIEAFRRGEVPVTLPSGRWLTIVAAFPFPNVVVQLGLDEHSISALAEALGEAAADAWFAGTLDLTRFAP